MKIEIEKDGLMVHCRQKDWLTAGASAAGYRDNPPNGYKLIRSVIKRRKQTGLAVNLTLDFEWVDDRILSLTHPEACEEFEHLEPFKGPNPQAQAQSPL